MSLEVLAEGEVNVPLLVLGGLGAIYFGYTCYYNAKKWIVIHRNRKTILGNGAKVIENTEQSEDAE